LIKFINKYIKNDYMGILCNNYPTYKKCYNNFMVNYFNKNQDDIKDPLGGIKLTIDEIRKFNEIPDSNCVVGSIMYLSKRCCNILVEHMTRMNFNIFYYREDIGYPYVIEDVGIGFILNTCNIYPVSCTLSGSLRDGGHINDVIGIR